MSVKNAVKKCFLRMGYDVQKTSRIRSLVDCDKHVCGMTSLAELELLYQLAKSVCVGCIVEVGSFRGRSTVALSFGAKSGGGAPVFAIEPHEPFAGVLGGDFGPVDRGEFFKTMLNSNAFENVRLVNLSSELVTAGWEKPVGLLWIDGDHSYNGVKRDFDCWEPHVAAGASIAFDDSLNPEIGPKRLIDELTARDGYLIQKVVGKITVLQKSGSMSRSELDRSNV